MENKKITISGSIANLTKIISLSDELAKNFHFQIFTPKDADNILQEMEVTDFEPIYRKSQAIQIYLNFIKQSDILLVANFDKGVKENYIGTGVLTEMSFAYALNKPIYIYNVVPDYLLYREDILALNPIVLNRNVEKLVNI